MDNLKVTIDLNALSEAGLTPSTYCALECVARRTAYPITDNDGFMSLIKMAEKDGFCKITEEGIILRAKFLSLRTSSKDRLDVESWIEEWRDLWPKGVRSGTRPVRGDKKGCLKKMRTLCNDNTNLTKEIVFDITKMYLREKANQGYSYIICADYFITKDGSSVLLALVDEYEDRLDSLERTSTDSGSAFHKEI